MADSAAWKAAFPVRLTGRAAILAAVPVTAILAAGAVARHPETLVVVNAQVEELGVGWREVKGELAVAGDVVGKAGFNRAEVEFLFALFFRSEVVYRDEVNVLEHRQCRHVRSVRGVDLEFHGAVRRVELHDGYGGFAEIEDSPDAGIPVVSDGVEAKPDAGAIQAAQTGVVVWRRAPRRLAPSGRGGWGSSTPRHRLSSARRFRTQCCGVSAGSAQSRPRQALVRAAKAPGAWSNRRTPPRRRS